MSALSSINIGMLNICRHGACLLRQNAMPRFRIVPLGSTQVATLFAIYEGKAIERRTPWPYKEVNYNLLFQAIDRTTARMNENSKIVVVEGSLATGKTEFAKFIAKEFDMLYVPDVTMDDLFIIKDRGCDVRQFDEQLPATIRSYQIESFYRDPKPLAGRVGNLQIAMYKERFMIYCRALHHMLSTGQGVILDRSPYGDFAHAEALQKCGYMTPGGLDYYNLHRRNSICELMEPHLTIYLDAPVEQVKENIKKRGIPYEVDNPILSDTFLQAIEDGYKRKLMPTMLATGHVKTFDITEGIDWEMVTEDLERINLDDPDEENNDRFDNWNTLCESAWASKRKKYGYGQEWELESYLTYPRPFDALELWDSNEDLEEWERVVKNDPAMDPPDVKWTGLRKLLSYPKLVFKAASIS